MNNNSRQLHYRVFQLPSDHPWVFLSSNYIEKQLEEKPSISRILPEYREVYTGVVETQRLDDLGVLEQIWEQLNVDHPDDYRARSLSVSDIVYLEDFDAHWFCDSFGWINLV